MVKKDHNNLTAIRVKKRLKYYYTVKFQFGTLFIEIFFVRLY